MEFYRDNLTRHGGGSSSRSNNKQEIPLETGAKINKGLKGYLDPLFIVCHDVGWYLATPWSTTGWWWGIGCLMCYPLVSA